MIVVNQAQCQAIAQRLHDQRVRPDEYLFPPSSPAETEREANYWAFIIAICQHTKSLQGWIDGQWCRGWDYLVRASRRLDEINQQVRRVVSDAGDMVIAHSGMTVFEFDKWVWHLGRSCCFYEHEPICGPRTCHKMATCTFIKAVDYDCPGRCSLDGVCKGSQDDSCRALWETNVYTEFY